MNAIARLAVVLLTSAVAATAVAQEMITANDAQIIPPAPSTAIFKRYMGAQPSLATGSVNVDVPIYTIECHGLSIPLSMRYNTSGIKVFDDSYPCGYGWALLPGLRVMRTILGRPDELFEYKGDLPNLGDDYTTTQRCMTMRELAAGRGDSNKYDSEHDIFTVCLIDGSHSFIMEKDGDNGCRFVGSGCSELKITADKDLHEIIATDAHGIRYIFGGSCEVTDMSYVTAWMLKCIELTNGEKIDFEWYDETHNPSIGVLVPDRYVDNLEPNTRQVSNGQNLTPPLAGNVEYLSPYKLFRHLKKISFPGGVVEMEYGGGLKTITVRHGSKTVKTVSLTYESGGYGYTRLLSRISVSDEGDYTFDYNSQKFDNPYAQDYWGYYNGSANAASLSPRLRRKFYKTAGYIEMGYADRSVDTAMMKANILTAVRYPTGGFTRYEYEPHRFNDPHVFFDASIHPDDNKPLTEGGGLRVVRIIDGGNDATTPVVRRYVYGPDENGLAECRSTPIAETFVSRHSVLEFDISTGVLPPPILDYDIVSISNSSNYQQSDLNGNNIWYKEVAEYIDGDGRYGKTVYCFDEMVTPNDLRTDDYGNAVPLALNKVFSPEIQKVSEAVYAMDGNTLKPVQTNSWTYALINTLPKAYSTKIVRQYYSTHDNPDAPDFGEEGYILVDVDTKAPSFPIRPFPLDYGDKDMYGAWRYSINFDKSILTSKNTTFYSDNGTRKVSTKYEYLEDSGIPRKVTTLVNGETMETLELYYPHSAAGAEDDMSEYSSQSPLFAAMVSDNILAVPVFTRLTRGNSEMSAQNILKYYGKRLYLPEKISARRGAGPFSVLGAYDYDAYGNLASRTSPDGVSETFLWAYYGRYPVAHVQGLDYGEVKSLAGESADLYMWPYGDYTAMTGLRNSLSNQGLLSAFEYRESVGLSAATDPAGFRSYYEYDSMNRLASVSVSGRTHTDEAAYAMSGRAFGVAVSADKTVYKAGETVGLTCSAENGSQRLSYKWRIIDDKGRPVALRTPTSATVRQALDAYGELMASCKVTDELKGISETDSVKFMVEPQSIEFSNIAATEESVSADIYCAHALKATFRVMRGVEPNQYRLLVDGTDYTESVSATEQFSVDFAAGTHSVQLEFTDGEAVGDVIMYILKVEGSYGETCAHEPIMISRDKPVRAQETDQVEM